MILTVAAVVGIGFLLGRALAVVGQPPVIGEVLAGIVLGPSLLGAVSPGAMRLFVPGPDSDPRGQVAAALRAVSQLGVVLYMFLVGLELNAAKLRWQAHAMIAISHASIVVPFVLGAALALWLYPLLSHRGVTFTSFSLFMGVAMAITAFPVLVRILGDLGLEKSGIGLVALGCAAADDVTAWCLLAAAVGVAQARTGGAVAVVAGAWAFVVVMLFLVRPLLVRVARRLDAAPGPLPPAAVSGTLVLVLLSALATELIGIHALFGAFVMGAILPHDSRIAREFPTRWKELVTVLLLPAFFAYTGMRTEIGLLNGWGDWLICGAIVLVATLGKFGGTLVAARLSGLSWRDAAALGALMNTRGLMELIVLNIGLDLGIIPPRLFTMMVLMALVTTLLAAPLLRRLVPAPHSRSDANRPPGE